MEYEMDYQDKSLYFHSWQTENQEMKFLDKYSCIYACNSLSIITTNLIT